VRKIEGAVKKVAQILGTIWMIAAAGTALWFWFYYVYTGGWEIDPLRGAYALIVLSFVAMVPGFLVVRWGFGFGRGLQRQGPVVIRVVNGSCFARGVVGRIYDFGCFGTCSAIPAPSR